MHVVEHALTDRGGTVTIEDPSMDALGTAEAKQLALTTAAARGITRPGISTDNGAYPVDAEGNYDEKKMLAGELRVAAYRKTFAILGGI